MISFADYQPPDSDEIIQLFLFTTIDEIGLGEIHTILEDSGQEIADGVAIAATPASSSLELEEGGKLWQFITLKFGVSKLSHGNHST